MWAEKGKEADRAAEMRYVRMGLGGDQAGSCLCTEKWRLYCGQRGSVPVRVTVKQGLGQCAM